MTGQRKSKNEILIGKIFPDSWGIDCVECPACQTFFPNVVVGQLIKCEKCNREFKVEK